MTEADKGKWNEFRKETETDTEATHRWMQWKCLTDLFFLGYEILGLKEAKDRTTGRRLVDPAYHRWLCDILSTDKDIMVIVPRRHMKTTWVKIKLIQNLLKNPFIRQAMYSSTSTLVEQELASVKRMLQNPLLMSLFPEVIPDPGKKGTGWQTNRAGELTLYRNPEDGAAPQECQIEVYGAGATVTGKHFDIHIYDDLINEKTTGTMEQLAKTRDWYGYIQGVLEPGGQEIYIGTPYHHEDLTVWIEREGIYDRIVKRGYRENGKIVYSYFTEATIKKLQKRMTSYQFSCQFECQPIPREDQPFPPPQPQYDVLPPGKYNWYIAVDPAATTKTWSDETAIVVAAVNELGWVYVEEALHFKKPGNEIAEVILRLNEQYKPRKVGIEFGLQEHLRHVIELTKSHWESVQKKPISMPVEGIDISKKDKYDRINLTVGSFIRSGKLRIKSNQTDLMYQMGLYNKNYTGKDDLVDALSMLFSIVDTFSYRYWREPLGIIKKGFFTIEELFKKKVAVGYNERFS